MKNKSVWIIIVLLILLSTGGMATWAQIGGGYDLTWHTIDGGVGHSDGGDYSVHGTIGQPDAGAMNGGDYSLQGGFWFTTQPDDAYFVYLPNIIN